MTTALAKRTATAVKLVPIAEVVAKIKGRIDDAAAAEATVIEHRLAAGQLLLHLRERIEAGEQGDVAWWDWFEANIERSRKDCERLMRMASSPDPDAALADERAKDRDRKRIARGADKALSAPKPDEDEERPNTGCNYDPADPRGEEEGEAEEVTRRRAWLYMAEDTKRRAAWFMGDGPSHVSMDSADPSEIDDEIMKPVWAAVQAWAGVYADMERKRASTLPADGRGWPG